MPNQDKPSPGTAICVGATGLIGRELLARLPKNYAQVIAVTRKPLASTQTGQSNLVIDFNQPWQLPQANALFCALGTTIKVAGSPEAFRQVDFDYVMKAAAAAQQAGVTHVAVVSAMGANAKSNVLYSRTKGEMEDALKALGFTSLLIVRPSLLEGDRASLSQPIRQGEKLALAMLKPFNMLIPKKYKAVAASAVAQCMVQRLMAMPAGVEILESDAIHAYA